MNLVATLTRRFRSISASVALRASSHQSTSRDTQIERLVDSCAARLKQDIFTRDPQIRRAILDIRGHVGTPQNHEIKSWHSSRNDKFSTGAQIL